MKHDSNGKSDVLLIEKINDLHKSIDGAARRALDNAIQVGEKLTGIKNKIGHGGWTEWVKDHLHFDIRTAQNYMRLYQDQHFLKSERISFLGEARKLIAAKKKERKAPKNPDSTVELSGTQLPAGDQPVMDHLHLPDTHESATDLVLLEDRNVGTDSFGEFQVIYGEMEALRKKSCISKTKFYDAVQTFCQIKLGSVGSAKDSASMDLAEIEGSKTTPSLKDAAFDVYQIESAVGPGKIPSRQENEF